MEVQLQPFLTSALEVSDHLHAPAAVPSGEIGECVGLRTGLGFLWVKKDTVPAWTRKTACTSVYSSLHVVVILLDDGQTAETCCRWQMDA